MTQGERDIFNRFCEEYANSLLPHIQKCFNVLCPHEQIAKMFGISLMEYYKLASVDKSLAYNELDFQLILEPLKTYIKQYQEISLESEEFTETIVNKDGEENTDEKQE